jgi:hypothetical protein
MFFTNIGMVDPRAIAASCGIDARHVDPRILAACGLTAQSVNTVAMIAPQILPQFVANCVAQAALNQPSFFTPPAQTTMSF